MRCFRVQSPRKRQARAVATLAAGIEFGAGDQTFRCWVWGNAVTLAEA